MCPEKSSSEEEKKKRYQQYRIKRRVCCAATCFQPPNYLRQPMVIGQHMQQHNQHDPPQLVPIEPMTMPQDSPEAAPQEVNLMRGATPQLSFGTEPCMATCPSCQTNSMTRIENVSGNKIQITPWICCFLTIICCCIPYFIDSVGGNKKNLAALICCLLTCICCFIPYFTDVRKVVVNHHCSCCGAYLK